MQNNMSDRKFLSLRLLGGVFAMMLLIGLGIALSFLFASRSSQRPQIPAQVQLPVSTNLSEASTNEHSAPVSQSPSPLDTSATKQIMFTDRSDAGDLQLYVLGITQDNLRNLSRASEQQATAMSSLRLDNGCKITKMTRTSDGQKLALDALCQDSLSDVYLFNQGTKYLRKVQGDSFYSTIKWFPDRQRLLVFDIQRDILGIGGANSGNVVQLRIPGDTSSISDADLSNDAKIIIYSSYDGLWQYNFEDGKRTRLADGAPYGNGIIAISPDNSSVVFSYIDHPDGTGILKLSSLNSTGIRQIAGQGLYKIVSWSPEGDLLIVVMSGTTDRTSHAYLLSLATGSQVPLAEVTDGSFTSVDWSSDGKYAVLGSTEINGGKIWLADILGHRVQQLYSTSTRSPNPIWLR